MMMSEHSNELITFDAESENSIRQATKRLDEAASRAANKVYEFGSIEDPYEESQDNPWSNPDQIMRDLKGLRDELMDAWHQLKKAHDDAAHKASHAKSEKVLSPEDQEDFRAQYMDMVTEAFADVLEGMREAEGDNLDVDVLVECLQSGMDLLNDEERDGFFKAFEEEIDDEADESASLSIHEIRRRDSGLDVPISTS